MALRSFTAPDGSRWDVWEVKPTTTPPVYSPQRTRERRGQDVLRYTGPERRRGERRKKTLRPAIVLPGYADGWLVFECGGEKRRLAPPPPGWDTCSDEDLAELWRRAGPPPGPGAGSGPG